jgi:hypothetical protein
VRLLALSDKALRSLVMILASPRLLLLVFVSLPRTRYSLYRPQTEGRL